MKTFLLKLLTLSLLLSLTSGAALAATTKKSKKKVKKTTKLKKGKRVRRVIKKKAPKPEVEDDTIFLMRVGYQKNDYKSINLATETGTEKLKTSGFSAAIGLEYEITDFISTTTWPTFSMGSQTRDTYGNYGENEVSTYAMMLSQALNMNFGQVNIFQLYIEGGVGYGWFSHSANWQSQTSGSRFSSELDVEGIAYEIAFGVNFKMINGFMPFVRMGIRKFDMGEETEAVSSSIAGASNELAIATQKNYSSATTVIGMGYEF